MISFTNNIYKQRQANLHTLNECKKFVIDLHSKVESQFKKALEEDPEHKSLWNKICITELEFLTYLELYEKYCKNDFNISWIYKYKNGVDIYKRFMLGQLPDHYSQLTHEDMKYYYKAHNRQNPTEEDYNKTRIYIYNEFRAINCSKPSYTFTIRFLVSCLPTRIQLDIDYEKQMIQYHLDYLETQQDEGLPNETDQEEDEKTTLE